MGLSISDSILSPLSCFQQEFDLTSRLQPVYNIFSLSQNTETFLEVALSVPTINLLGGRSEGADDKTCSIYFPGPLPKVFHLPLFLGETKRGPHHLAFALPSISPSCRKGGLPVPHAWGPPWMASPR